MPKVLSTFTLADALGWFMPLGAMPGGRVGEVFSLTFCGRASLTTEFISETAPVLEMNVVNLWERG